MKVLVTGAAGFIGSRLSYMLAQRGDEVIGIDNINDYYDVRMKYGRLKANGFIPSPEFQWHQEYESTLFPNLHFIRMGIHEREAMEQLFSRHHFDKVINLAAQAGVRYSLVNPYAYMESNLQGFLVVLECCRNYDVKHLVFASSSSVYGQNSKVPYSEEDRVDNPVSLYAATKKSNELMAHCYSNLYGFAVSGLRYFTVYGPWGRPDMAPMLFTRSIRQKEPIRIFNEGKLSRDFTYIDDIVEGTIRVLDRQTNNQADAYRIYNIGCGQPVPLMDFIHLLENELQTEAIKEYLPMQPGDVYHTFASTTHLKTDTGYTPKVSLKEGIHNFISWYLSSDNPLKV